MKPRAAAALGAGLVFSVAVACSSSNEGTRNDAGSCATLASQCHPYASKSALGKECHDLGHAGDDSKCGPRLAQCQAECPLIDGGDDLPFKIVDGQVVNPPGTDASVDPADAASTDAICAAYCDCLQPTCGSQTQYLYSSIEQCRGTCATFTEEERTCWSKFCDRAKALSEANRQHECDHAQGKLNLDECDEIQ